MDSIIFKEKQRMDSLWPLLILAITLVVNWFIYYYNPNEDLSILYKSVIASALAAAFLSLIKLETVITKDEIRYKLFPINFSWNTIYKKDIHKATVMSVKPIKDYGGWGYRRGLKSKAYLVKGKDGIRLDLDNGQHIFIGTQKKEELERVVKRLGF